MSALNNDDEVFIFYDLKKNNKELFNKKFHGYVLGRKIPVLYDITDIDDDGYISKTARALHDINEIYEIDANQWQSGHIQGKWKNKNF